jgi:hypothetical protein
VVARRRAGPAPERSPCWRVVVREVRNRTVRVGVVPGGKDAGVRAGVENRLDELGRGSIRRAVGRDVTGPY